MAVSNNLNAKGLYTFSNYYSQIPPGSQSVADNVNIDRDGVIEPRRGFKQFATIPANEQAKQLLVYKDTILAHYDTKLAFYDGAGFTDFTTAIPEVQSGLRIKGVEQNGNFYFTSNDGIKKLSAQSSSDFSSPGFDSTNAGGVKALNTSLQLNATIEGFLDGGHKVGYRVVWSTTDVNNNLILGSPSAFTEITNTGSNSSVVDVTIQVPDEVTADYKFQIYRTTIVPQNVDLTDELKLVFEQQHDGLTDEYTIVDIYSEDLRVAATSLYTNEFSGEGILQANIQPPVAKDITSYKNSTFFANTRSKEFLLNTFLGTSALTYFDILSIVGPAPVITLTVTSTAGLTNGDKIALIGTGAYNIDGIYTIASVTPTTFDITIIGALGAGPAVTGGAVAYNSYVSIDSYNFYFVGRRARTQFVFTSGTKADYKGKYITIYSAEDRVTYVLWFQTDGTDIYPTVTGATYIEVDIQTAVSASDIRQAFEDTIINTVYDLEVSSSTPPGTCIIDTASSGQTTTATHTSITGLTITLVQDGVGVDSYSGIQTSTERLTLLSTYLSSASQIEETTKELMRSINYSDAGVYGYYLSSQEGLPGEFTLEAQSFNSSFTLSASSSDLADNFNTILPQTSAAEVFPNRIVFSKTNQPEAVTLASYIDVGPKDKEIKRIIGLRDSLFIFKEEGIYRLYGSNSTNFAVTLFDSSANITATDSAAILNNQIYVLTSQGVATVSETGVSIISRPIENFMIKASTIADYKTLGFGVTSESDRAYMLALPDNIQDTEATRIYRYNTFTQAWTSWVRTYRCGAINPSENKLYFGSAIDSEVEVERKNLNRKDFSDREYTKQITIKSGTNKYILSDIDFLDEQDIIVQTQHLTIAQYNRFVNQLNTDATISTQIGFTPFVEVSAGVNLASKLSALQVKLSTLDPLGTYPVPSGINLGANLQTDFNALVNAANASDGVDYDNYQLSEGTVEYEAHVLSFNRRTFDVTLSDSAPFIIGEVLHETGIDCTIIWSPETFGDVINLKHVREGRIYFENVFFAGGTLGYSSDITGNFEDIEFGKEGNSDWGANPWDSFAWGGEGLQYPFRTLIPRQKQRCRMIKTRFKHRYARDRFLVYGIGYVFETTGERTNK